VKNEAQIEKEATMGREGQLVFPAMYGSEPRLWAREVQYFFPKKQSP